MNIKWDYALHFIVFKLKLILPLFKTKINIDLITEISFTEDIRCNKLL